MRKLPTLSTSYKNAVSEFRSVLKAVDGVSASNKGLLTTTGQQTYGNYAFTLMCARAHSFSRLIPGLDKSNSTRGAEWDYMALAMLARAIMDLRFAFYYIAVDPCTKDEWEARWGLFNLHDCLSRISIGEKMEGFGCEQPNLKHLRDVKEELQKTLATNCYFSSSTFTDNQRARFLKGGGPFLYGVQEFSTRAGVPPPAYKYFQELFSTLAHGHPYAIYSLANSGMQQGIPSPVEEAYCVVAIEAVNSFLSESVAEYVALSGGFPRGLSDTRERLHRPVVDELITLAAESDEPIEILAHGRFSAAIYPRLRAKVSVQDRFALPLVAHTLNIPQVQKFLEMLGLTLTAKGDGSLWASFGQLKR